MRSCNTEVPVPGIFGSEWCDASWGLINDSIVAMGNIKKNVDFILWTGDSIPHIDDKHMNETYILYVMKTVTDAIRAEFPDVKVYATMGNNDWYLSDQFTPTGHRLYNETADMWKDWIVNAQQIDNFRKGGYYTLKTEHGLRIVGLNTNVYYFRDELTNGIADPVGQFAWLEEVLQDAKTAGEKILLTSHVPPGVHAPGSIQWYYDNFNTRFLNITSRFSDIIVGMFCGHDHDDVLKLVKDTAGSPGFPIYIAPCLTPWRYRIPTETGKPHNPAIRLVKYNQNTHIPMEIQQYYMDLHESNRRKVSNWTLAYSTSQAYGMPDLSAGSLSNLMKKMKTDKPTLDKYIRFNTVLANGETTVRSCDTTCRARIICSFTYLDKKSFDTCVAARVSGSAKLYPTSILFMIIVVISTTLL